MSIGAMLAERDFLYRKEQPPWGRPDNKTLSLTLEIPYVFKSIKYWFNFQHYLVNTMFPALAECHTVSSILKYVLLLRY